MAGTSNQPEGEPSPEFIFSAPRRGRPTVAVSPTLFSVSRQTDDTGALTLRTHGRLDLNTVLAFRDTMFSALGERPSRLTVDLSDVGLVEASGISSLVTLARVAALVGVPLDVVPSPAFSQTLTDTGLERLLHPKPPTGAEIAERLLAN